MCSVDLAQLKQTFSKFKFTKFLTLVEIVRLGPEKGTKGELRCGRSDLTLRRGKWGRVFYGYFLLNSVHYQDLYESQEL